MNELLIGLLGAALSTNQPAALSNVLSKAAGVRVHIPDPASPAEKEYQKILKLDDEAQAEVDQWIKDAQTFSEKGAGLPQATLNAKIRQRFEPVHAAYRDFIQRHPAHAGARLAYGSFLTDIGEEEDAVVQMEKAREIEPRNPATWNNLANYYGHRGPVTNAFAYYAKAIELNPQEPVYYQNLATTVFLFRKDAREFYGIDEQKVFDRAMELYGKALKLDPANFPLATDVAQTYYGIKPMRLKEALAAWNYALKIANDDIERQGVYLHLARLQLNNNEFFEARTNLALVTNEMYTTLKSRLVRNLAEKQEKAAGTNPPARPLESPAK